MSEFSALLDHYIERSKLTENQLAKISGFTRSHIALIKSGRRVPADVAKLKRLMDALLLSPGCQERLWRAYYIERYGRELYETRMEIKKFIRDLRRSDLSSDMIPKREMCFLGDMQPITGHLDIELAVRTILNHEARKTHGHIKLILQGDFDFVYSQLAVMVSKPIQIEHIVCLRDNHIEYAHGQHEGLKFLLSVIPAVLADAGNRYEIFYYHGDPDCQFGVFSLMPYMIMTSEYVINISGDQMTALVIRNPEIHTVYDKLFEKSKSTCQAMLCRDMEKKGLPTSAIEEPEYILSGMLPNITSACPQISAKDIKSIYISQDSILDSFVKCPKTGYRNLENLVQGVKAGRYHIYLLKNIECSNELQITVHGLIYVEIIVGDKKMTIREQGIVQMFYSFLLNMEHNEYICSETEGLQFLESVLLSKRKDEVAS